MTINVGFLVVKYTHVEGKTGFFPLKKEYIKNNQKGLNLFDHMMTTAANPHTHIYMAACLFLLFFFAKSGNTRFLAPSY